MGLQVDGGGQEDPRHLLQARLRKALLATVLQEPLPLDRERRDKEKPRLVERRKGASAFR